MEFFTDLIDLSCYQNATGSIVFNASEGTPNYQYSIDNGISFSPNPIFDLLDAQTYDLVVVDANGCQVIGTETLTEPPLLLITDVNPTDAVCFGYCDGTASSTVQGGTVQFDYNYEWTQAGNPIGDEATIEDLCPNAYNLLVTDDNGCSHTLDFEIFEPVPMVIDSIHFTSPICFDACDGTIEVFASTAVSYSFYGGALLGPSSTIGNLCDGPYYIYVEDIDGCIAYDSTTVNMINPAELVVVAGPDTTICPGGSGFLTAEATGGTGTLTYHWDNGVNTQNQTVMPAIETLYIVTVEDEFGCFTTFEDTTVVSLYDALSILVSNDTIVCPGSPVSLNSQVLTGESPYFYDWSVQGTSISSDSSLLVTPSELTTYVIEITDFCTTLVDSVVVDTFFTPEVIFAADELNGCTPMTVTIESTIDPAIFGGNCAWEFSDGTVINGCGPITATFDELGCYSVTFTGTSIYGCALSGYGDDVFCVRPNPVANFLYSPDAPTFIDSYIEFTNISHDADYADWTFSGYGTSTEINPSILVSNSNTGDTIMACLLASTIYGCTDEICQPIVMIEPYLIYVPNTFTPDGDQYNNTFFPVFPPNYQLSGYSMLVFNRWGELIFESLDPEYGWDGTYNGILCQDGTYTWKISVTDGQRGEKYNYVGHINMIR